MIIGENTLIPRYIFMTLQNSGSKKEDPAKMVPERESFFKGLGLRVASDYQVFSSYI